MKDHEVVEAFVAHLAANGYPGLCVDKWPERENRKSPDIEAIAGQFAIEHTSIDTLPNQRGKSHWFMRAAGELEKELPKLPFFVAPRDGLEPPTKWLTATRSTC
jgi:hypothetical protein